MSARIWSREWFSTMNTSTFETGVDVPAATGLEEACPAAPDGDWDGDWDWDWDGAASEDGGFTSAPHPASGRTSTLAATASRVRVRCTLPLSPAHLTAT